MVNLQRFGNGESPVASAKLNLIVDALTGTGNTPVNHGGVNDPINYALTVRNQDTAGKALIVYAPDGVTALLQVTTTGVLASPSGGAASAIVTTSGTQTLTNKTLTSPIINGVQFPQTPFVQTLTVDTATAGTQMLLSQTGLASGAVYWVSFGIYYQTTGAAGTEVVGIVEDTAAGGGTFLLLGHAAVEGGFAYVQGSGRVVVGAGGVLALYLFCNGTSGTTKLRSPLLTGGVSTFFEGFRIA